MDVEGKMNAFLATTEIDLGVQMNIPEETPLPANNNLNLNYPQFSNGYNMQPAQYNWAILQNQSLQPQLHELHTNAQMQQSGPSRPTHRPAPVAIANEEAPNTVNINLGLDTTTISYLSSLFRARNPPATVTRVLATSHHDPTLVSSSNHNPVEVTVPSVTGFESYENIRASMLRTVHPGFVETDREPPSNKAAVAPGEEPQRVMNMANRPLSPDLLSRLANENKR
ncbi:hypothetical protein N7462_010359 [Penicillium macrosclerotiorum]|uniref:uncharacterized protein n=1 Tax=Penicillium macrosclerotiorum TaxID=303699 RepID=UPI0025497699|nr:uncharacterized protein N7462_010359 [Penicillium macrosclerotiorum]KAJ5669289.1 hypothetical protein N7462_010359 [Penicillium macrosclerotiorum]